MSFYRSSSTNQQSSNLSKLERSACREHGGPSFELADRPPETGEPFANQYTRLGDPARQGDHDSDIERLREVDSLLTQVLAD